MNKKFGLLVVGILVVAGSCMPIMGVALTSEDQRFLNWVARTSEILSADCRLMELAGERHYDLDGLAIGSKWLHDDANKALIEIDHYHVSSVLKHGKSEFKLGLQDLKQAGYYFNGGARNTSGDDIEKGCNYLESAERHMRKAEALLST